MLILGRFVLLGLLMLVSAVYAVNTKSLEVRVVPAITDNIILEDYRPPTTDQPALIRMVAAPDEYEPASFVVFANEQIDDLQLTATDLISAEGTSLSGALLDVRIVKRWYQRNYGGSSDPADLRLRYMTPELLVYDDTLIKVEGNDNYLRMQSGKYIDISKK